MLKDNFLGSNSIRFVNFKVVDILFFFLLRGVYWDFGEYVYFFFLGKCIGEMKRVNSEVGGDGWGFSVSGLEF